MNRSKMLIPVIMAALMLLVFCTPAMAWQVMGADEGDSGWQKLGTEVVVDDDLLIFGNEIQVDGKVNGDLLIFGQNVTINGVVSGDTIVFANAVTLNGTTAGDFRGAMQDVRIAGTVGGNMTVATNSVSVEKTGRIAKNATLAGSKLVVNGPVDGRLDGGFSSAVINSGIGKGALLKLNRLELGPLASINGPLDYTSSNELTKDAAAVVNGKITRTEPPVKDTATTPASAQSGSGFFTFFGAIAGIVASFIIWLIWTAIHRRSFESMQEQLADRPLPSLGWGMLAIIATPVACLLVLVTIIGIPISVMAFMIYILVFMISSTVTGCYIGARINDYVKKESLRRPWVEALLGITILQIACTIPLLGFWISLAASALCFGALILALAAGRKPLVEMYYEKEIQEPEINS